jgi:hypothetical protein
MPFFFIKIIYKKKNPSAKAKGLQIVWLPLFETFRTFKEDVTKKYQINKLIIHNYK